MQGRYFPQSHINSILRFYSSQLIPMTLNTSLYHSFDFIAVLAVWLHENHDAPHA